MAPAGAAISFHPLLKVTFFDHHGLVREVTEWPKPFVCERLEQLAPRRHTIRYGWDSQRTLLRTKLSPGKEFIGVGGGPGYLAGG